MTINRPVLGKTMFFAYCIFSILDKEKILLYYSLLEMSCEKSFFKEECYGL